MKNTFDLTGKNVLITGGDGFLGAIYTKELSNQGANVIVNYHNDSAKADQLVKDIKEEYQTDPMSLQMDVTNKDSIVKGFKTIVDKYGHIDVVINNAAIDAKFDSTDDKNEALFENYPEELISQSLDTNLKGYVLVAQEAVKHMLTQEEGNIINVSSIYGLGGPYQHMYPEGTQKPVDYSITKGGIIMLTKYLAATYSGQGIRTNTYSLGGVLKDHSEDFQQQYGAHTPNGRMVLPEEVGAPLAFLASDASAGMTGANLVVDGGWTAW